MLQSRAGRCRQALLGRRLCAQFRRLVEVGCRRGVKHTADFRPDEHIAGDVPDPDLHHQAGQPNLPFAARGSSPCPNQLLELVVPARRAPLCIPGQWNGCRLLWIAYQSSIDGWVPFVSVEVILRFGLPPKQPILDHVRQQLLNSFLQRHGLFGTQKHRRHGDFPSRFPHDMARLRIPEL